MTFTTQQAGGPGPHPCQGQRTAAPSWRHQPAGCMRQKFVRRRGAHQDSKAEQSRQNVLLGEASRGDTGHCQVTGPLPTRVTHAGIVPCTPYTQSLRLHCSASDAHGRSQQVLPSLAAVLRSASLVVSVAVQYITACNGSGASTVCMHGVPGLPRLPCADTT